MRIGTYNVNGINGRLANLLGWLEEAVPDIVCLQELKAPDEKFPVAALCAAGYGAIWHGQKSWNGVAILARGAEPVETRRGLPGDPDDMHSRYIEAAIGGLIVGCLYLPNGNPAPGPKFDYKLRWFDRLTGYAQILLDSGAQAILAGDFNVMPTDLDVYAPERWVDDALFRPEVREAYRRLIEQGWTDALRTLHPGERIYTFWKYFRNAFARDAGLRIDHMLLSPSLAGRLAAAGVNREVRAREHSSDHAPVWIPPGGIYPCKPGGSNDYVYLLTSRANPEHWPRLLKLIGREDLIGDERYATPDARLRREAEVDAIVTGWTKERTKQEAMAQLSAVGVPAGAVLDTQELIDEPSFYERGILQQMTHGERNMVMPTWPVRFDSVPTKVEPAPLLGEHTTEVLSDWLGLDAAAIAQLRQDGIV